MFIRKILGMFGCFVVLGGNFGAVFASSPPELQTQISVSEGDLRVEGVPTMRAIQDFTENIRYERLPIKGEVARKKIEMYINTIFTQYGNSEAIATASLFKMSFDNFDQAMSGACVILIHNLAKHLVTNIELVDHIMNSHYSRDTDAISLAAQLLYSTGNGEKQIAHAMLRTKVVPIMKELGLGMYVPEGF
ncbi:MAG: hypothetical protein LBI26_01725 [Holosporales bacterium]|jgi:hypothetical protein|nr:hypothetical protein [Holosporales bacterium]